MKEHAGSPLVGVNAISREIPAADPELAHPVAGDLDMCRLMRRESATRPWHFGGRSAAEITGPLAVVGNLLGTTEILWYNWNISF